MINLLEKHQRLQERLLGQGLTQGPLRVQALLLVYTEMASLSGIFVSCLESMRRPRSPPGLVPTTMDGSVPVSHRRKHQATRGEQAVLRKLGLDNLNPCARALELQLDDDEAECGLLS